MPELEPQTRSPTTRDGASSGAADDLGPDPLASLHKMSTTAGVGSQDYVAINTLAVTTAVLGLGTAFAFISPIFLIVGVAAIVCGLIAIRQINNSNGTQGGRWLAVLGIIIALVFAGVVGANKLGEIRAHREMARDVNAVVDQLAQHLVAGEFDKAYALTDPAFRSVITQEQFAQTLRAQQAPEYNGKLLSMRGNGVVNPGLSDGRAYAYTQAIIQFDNRKDEPRATLILSRDDAGQWRLNRIVEMFQPQLRARGINPSTSSPLR